MHRCRAAGAEVKIGLLQRGGARVGKVEAQIDHVIALALVGFRHGVGFADFEAIGQFADENGFVRRSARDGRKATEGDTGFFGQSADGQGLGDVQGNVRAILAEVLEQFDGDDASGVAGECEVGEPARDRADGARHGCVRRRGWRRDRRRSDGRGGRGL